MMIRTRVSSIARHIASPRLPLVTHESSERRAWAHPWMAYTLCDHGYLHDLIDLDIDA